MADLRYAQVCLKDQPVGVLRETPSGGTEFAYDAGIGVEIACTLPAHQRTHTWAQGLHPFFQHLTPEGWLRGKQARQSEIEPDDDLGLLLRYGRDCIGAVSVINPDAPAYVDLTSGADPLDTATAQPRTLSGVQPKILVTKSDDDYVPAGPDGLAPYIAKFPSEDLPDLVVNEDLTLKLCRDLLGRGAVTEAHRGFVQGLSRPALLVRRFDRGDAGEKCRLEDFAQLLNKPRGRDFNGKYDASFEDCACVIRTHSARAEVDLLRFFERIIVFFLLGNGDAHLKNFSLLEGPDGLRLSPAYDVVNTYVYGARGYTTRFGIRIGGDVLQHDQVTRAVLLQLGDDIGLPKTAVPYTIERFRKPIQKVLAEIPAPSDRNDDLLGPYARSVQTFAQTLFDTD